MIPLKIDSSTFVVTFITVSLLLRIDVDIRKVHMVDCALLDQNTSCTPREKHFDDRGFEPEKNFFKAEFLPPEP